MLGDEMRNIGHKLSKFAGPIAGGSVYFIGNGLIQLYEPIMDQTTKNQMNNMLVIISSTVGGAVDGYQKGKHSMFGYAAYSCFLSSVMRTIDAGIPDLVSITLHSSMPKIAHYMMRDIIDNEEPRART